MESNLAIVIGIFASLFVLGISFILGYTVLWKEVVMQHHISGAYGIGVIYRSCHPFWFLVRTVLVFFCSSSED